MSRKQRIYDLIVDKLSPLFLTVDDESHQHHVPKDAQTHFKLLIVSEKFRELKLVERHRIINGLLADEFKNGLHALSLHLFTAEEWEAGKTPPQSPACRDGYRNA